MELSAKVNVGEIEDDVEALAQLVEFAAPHYIEPGVRSPRGHGPIENKKALGNDLGIVLGGNEFTFWEGMESLSENHGGILGIVRDYQSADLTLAEIGDAVTNRCRNTDYSPDDMCQYYTGFNAFGTSGFKDEYSEKGGNQVAHFAGGLSALANGGKFGLESTRSGETNPPDYNLYGAALDLWQSGTRLTGWGDWIRKNLAQ